MLIRREWRLVQSSHFQRVTLGGGEFHCPTHFVIQLKNVCRLDCDNLNWIAIQYNAVQNDTIQCHTIQCYTIWYTKIPYHTTPYRTTPYHTIPHHATPYHIIPYHTTLYQTITMPYYTIKHIKDILHISLMQVFFCLGRLLATSCINSTGHAGLVLLPFQNARPRWLGVEGSGHVGVPTSGMMAGSPLVSFSGVDRQSSWDPVVLPGRVTWNKTTRRDTPRKYVFDVTSIGQRKYIFDVTSIGQRKYVFDVTSIGQRKYVFDVTSIGQRSSACDSVKVEITFHFKCKLHFPCAQLMLRQMHLTNLTESIEANYWVSWPSFGV